MKKLPVGYLFSPSDEEIINHFLHKKVRGEALSCDYVKDCDVYGDKEPWKLFDKTAKQNFYVFVRLRKRSINGSTVKRTAGCGTWDGQSSRPIIDRQGRDIGSMKFLRFEVAKQFESHAKDNGRWLMHEFSMNGNSDGYVLCRIRNSDHDKIEPSLKRSSRKCSHLEEQGISCPVRKRIRNSVSVVGDVTEPMAWRHSMPLLEDQEPVMSMALMAKPEIGSANSDFPWSHGTAQWCDASQKQETQGNSTFDQPITNSSWYDIWQQCNVADCENQATKETQINICNNWEFDFGIEDFDDVPPREEIVPIRNANQNKETQDSTIGKNCTRVCLDSETIDQLIRVSNSKVLWEQLMADDNKNQVADDDCIFQETKKLDSFCNWEYSNHCALDDFYDCMLN